MLNKQISWRPIPKSINKIQNVKNPTHVAHDEDEINLKKNKSDFLLIFGVNQFLLI